MGVGGENVKVKAANFADFSLPDIDGNDFTCLMKHVKVNAG